MVHNENQKPFTSYIKGKTKSITNVGPLRVGSEVISNDKEMATLLNRYFCSVFSQKTLTMLIPVPLYLPIVQLVMLFLLRMKFWTRLANLKLTVLLALIASLQGC